MASAVACKGAAPASLLKSGASVAFCALHSPAVTVARRPYNTQVKEVGHYGDDDYCDCDLIISSSYVLDPHSALTSMTRLLSLIGFSSIAGASRLGRWVAREDDHAGADGRGCTCRWFNDSSDDIRGCCDKALQILCAHYGWETVDVTVPEVEEMRLAHCGEGEKQPWDGDDDSAVPRYNRRMEMPTDAYKINKIKAEMKNGVL
ncbi:26.2 kDa heat shock protein, mitochondrial-like [Triticum dicoccoides]|uniref:26.2 kDa heat shock protein, mitochondrial-like n=1 Tax=Triticum dicoccoides TaxID=85692 RepID=UPI0018909BC1|nr:26.2 kDa heat shock protein, mitochondrial-like [Triticum dicoccoides]